MLNKPNETIEQEIVTKSADTDSAASHALANNPEAQFDKTLEETRRAEDLKLADTTRESLIGMKPSTLVELDKNYLKDVMRRDPKLNMHSVEDPTYRYFTVLGVSGEKLGIIGVYNTDDDKNAINIIIDPKYRGLGLAAQFYDLLIDTLNLPFVTLTIDYDPHRPDDPSFTNIRSMRAAEKLPGVERVYEKRFEEIQKAKFIYKGNKKKA